MIKKYLFIAFFLFSASRFYAQTPLQSAVDFSVKTLKGDIIQLYPLLEQNKIVVIPQAGHWVHAEAPQLFFETVNEFLN